MFQQARIALRPTDSYMMAGKNSLGAHKAKLQDNVEGWIREASYGGRSPWPPEGAAQG